MLPGRRDVLQRTLGRWGRRASVGLNDRRGWEDLTVEDLGRRDASRCRRGWPWSGCYFAFFFFFFLFSFFSPLEPRSSLFLLSLPFAFCAGVASLKLSLWWIASRQRRPWCHSWSREMTTMVTTITRGTGLHHPSRTSYSTFRHFIKYLCRLFFGCSRPLALDVNFSKGALLKRGLPFSCTSSTTREKFRSLSPEGEEQLCIMIFRDRRRTAICMFKLDA